jgi:hypothetical protein
VRAVAEVKLERVPRRVKRENRTSMLTGDWKLALRGNRTSRILVGSAVVASLVALVLEGSFGLRLLVDAACLLLPSEDTLAESW